MRPKFGERDYELCSAQGGPYWSSIHFVDQFKLNEKPQASHLNKRAYSSALEHLDSNVLPTTQENKSYCNHDKKANKARKVKPKKKKVTINMLRAEAERYMDRVNNVQGVDDHCPVFDSCCEVRRKITQFLKKEGVTKSSFTRSIQVNHKSLNCFLAGVKQLQSGNCTYRAGYVFFERMRIMEGVPKNPERIENEQKMAFGFNTKPYKASKVQRNLITYGMC
eukprot:CAMPEP_0184870738 /NCGR_PEP_ID=MMETSP0580-20130426/38615_1 /TAXON_ID=1118495 /ORGANISM="Dactyliosolen fragilissimus" /LENGTH=221 /DNA_ID=CAMNT_0027373003 /DNA_START=70 /DNA_END=735 /DNA_ORIENTATION=-